MVLCMHTMHLGPPLCRFVCSRGRKLLAIAYSSPWPCCARLGVIMRPRFQFRQSYGHVFLIECSRMLKRHVPSTLTPTTSLKRHLQSKIWSGMVAKCELRFKNDFMTMELHFWKKSTMWTWQVPDHTYIEKIVIHFKCVEHPSMAHMNVYISHTCVTPIGWSIAQYGMSHAGIAKEHCTWQKYSLYPYACSYQ